MSEGPKAPAGWYPADGGRERYWDGDRWTDAYRLAEGPPMPAPSARSERSPLDFSTLLLTAGGLAMIVAAFLPYVESRGFGEVAQNTLIEQDVGWAFVGLGLSAIYAAYQHHVGPGGAWGGKFLIGLLGLGLALYLGIDEEARGLVSVDPFSGEEGSRVTEVGDPGIGTYIAGFGSLLVLLASLGARGQAVVLGGESIPPLKPEPATAAPSPVSHKAAAPAAPAPESPGPRFDRRILMAIAGVLAAGAIAAGAYFALSGDDESTGSPSSSPGLSEKCFDDPSPTLEEACEDFARERGVEYNPD